MMRTATRSVGACCSSLRSVTCARTYASASASSSSTPAETPSLPSSAPPGTVLKGCSIYKDRPDPIALEDHKYPSWLFNLLDDSSIASSSSLASIEMSGMSKGEARAAQKRQAKVLRAAQVAKEKADAKAAERAAKSRSVNGDLNSNLDQQVSSSQEAQQVSLLSKAALEELAKRKALRKANKEAIKARNFVSAS